MAYQKKTYNVRCSQANYLFTCPPSVLDDQLLRVTKATKEAAIGSALHTAAVSVVKNNPIDYDNICKLQGLSEPEDAKEVADLTGYMRMAWGKLNIVSDLAEEIDPDWFIGVEKVGVTAGASTPRWLIDEVVGRIAELGK